MKKYTTTEVVQLLSIAQSQLSNYRTGGGDCAAILTEDDYERVIENGRAKIYYYESALEKIRERRANRYKKRV